jgi:D-alanyl-lipoteichoic acid acyltransferase DltB (MBOAT superfamily)
MLFNSLQFLIFFPLVVTVYFAIDHKYRWAWLLAASCCFYMAFIPVYILILLFTVTIDYAAGILIEKQTGQRRKLALLLSILANVGVLGFFKYCNFFIGNAGHMAGLLHLSWHPGALSILLPIGLSFHTFQSMSYTIEVYRGRQKAERHFGILALYVLFFPQLVAGPIERPYNLLPQFRVPVQFDYDRVTSGLRLMAWGYFKKVVIADHLSMFVNGVYGNPTAYKGMPLILATYLFAFQIFCDFSGYSDIAIGAARVMGIRLMNNFNRPYIARSIPDFWHRWHISLSTWFRDYLYIPLGGSRVAMPRLYLNLMIVFLISGLWHGASWTFAVWGALHGLFMLSSRAFAPFTKGVAAWFEKRGLTGAYHLAQIFVTFNLVSFAWIFFRAGSVSDAWYIASHLLSFKTGLSLYGIGLGIEQVAIGVVFIGVLEAVHLFQNKHWISQWFLSKPAGLRWAVYACLLLSIHLFGVLDTPSHFIYFQF